MPQQEQGSDPVVAVQQECSFFGASMKHPLPRDHETCPGTISRAPQGLVCGWHGSTGRLYVQEFVRTEDVRTERLHLELRRGCLKGDAPPILGHQCGWTRSDSDGVGGGGAWVRGGGARSRGS